MQVSSYGGGVADNSMLPTNLNLTGGARYSITANEGNGYIFDHWSTGQTSNSISILLNSTVSLTAEYVVAGLQTISVLGRDQNNRTVAGTSVDFYANGVFNGSDVLPANFTAKYGDNVSVVAPPYTSLSFKYWNNNHSMTSEADNFTVRDNTSLTVDYQTGPIPYTAPGAGNHTITVISHTPDGGELVGAYFQIRIHGVWNDYAQGWTPASIQVPAGTEELVMYHCARVAPCLEKYFVYRHYNDTQQTLTRWTYIDLQSDVTVNSVYEIMPENQTVNVHVNGVNASNYKGLYNCTCGALITIYQNGQPVAQSLSPYSFFLWAGRNYTVNLGPIQGYAFIRWDDGVTSSNRSFIATPVTVDTNDSDLYDQDLFGVFQMTGPSSSSPSSPDISSSSGIISNFSAIILVSALIGIYLWTSEKIAQIRWVDSKDRLLYPPRIL